MSRIMHHVRRTKSPEIEMEAFFEKLSHRSAHRAKKLQARRWRVINKFSDSEEYETFSNKIKD